MFRLRSVPAITLLIMLLALPGGALATRRALPPRSELVRLQTTTPTGRIVIKFAEGTGVQVTESGLVAKSSGTALRLTALLKQIAPAATLERRFSRSPAEIAGDRAVAQARSGRVAPDLNLYGVLTQAAPAGDRDALLRIIKRLAADPAVETAFLEPVAQPASLGVEAGITTTPDFSGQQGYLGSPPEGINALAVSGLPGGGGTDVRVLDVEGAWLWSHEDLPDPFATIGQPLDDLDWRNHGTAVMGVIRGRNNGLGVLGIAPACSVGGSSIGDQWTADAINNAAAMLQPGDVILIELHAPGPNANGSGQFGFVPMEFWQDNFDAIQLATALGVIVCEAAGNGQQDLDDPIYQGLFDRDQRDSGAIMCGASTGSSLSPAWFTNYGSRVDLQGWGSSVTTCAYGNLQGPPDYPEEEWYTGTFNGTSSASPIVVGAVVSLQGLVKHAFGMPLDARLARDILAATGTPQSGTNHIGPRPDLVAAWSLASAGIGQVTGTITSAGTGLPLAGVLVRVDESGSFDVTGSDGVYRVSLLVGSYDLSFTSFFYQDAILPAVVGSGGTTTLDVALVRKPTVDFAGRVFGSTGSPLAGVRVTPQKLPLGGAVSGPDGRFWIGSAPTDTVYEFLFDSLPGHGAGFKAASSAVPPGSEVSLVIVLPEVYEDFETGDGGFLADPIWSYGTPEAGGPSGGFSGTRCWGVGMTGNYGDDEQGSLTSPIYDFSSASISRLLLSFHYWMETESGFDGVQLLVFDGEAFVERAPLEGYTDLSLSGLGYHAGWSGESGGWRGTVFDLTDLIGSVVMFRLTFGSDSGVNGPGFWFDDIAFDDGTVATGVGDDGAVAGPSASSLVAFPNPCNPATTISWRTTGPGPLKIRVYDLRGRLIRTLLDERVAGSAGTVAWNGRDRQGRQVASGAYLVRLQGPGGVTACQRLSLVQ